MLEEDTMEVPSEQRMERNQTLHREHVEEHKAALRRAVTLSMPDARAPSPYGTFSGDEHRHCPERNESFPPVGARQRMSWNDLIEQVFDRDEDGQIVLRTSSFFSSLTHAASSSGVNSFCFVPPVAAHSLQ
uniref:Uncharacterized protein n=1 Tax=Arundo donax TaxID=35708 RepID=A0A0A9FCR3_ARUDO